MNQFNHNILFAFWQSTPIVKKVFIIIAPILRIIELFIGNQLQLFFVLVAFLEFIIYKGPMFRLPKRFIESIEKKIFLQKYISRQDFIPIDQAYDLVFQGTQKIEFQIENLNKDMEISPVGLDEQLNRKSSN